MEYFVISALLIIGIVKYDFKYKSEFSDKYFWFLFVLISLMSGLAYRVGADLVGYEESFYTDYRADIDVIISDIFTLSRIQPGWTIVSTIVYKTTHSFLVFKIIQAFFFQFAVFITIKRYTQYRYTALLLFFVFLFPQANFNVLRESIAIAIFLLSLPALISHNYRKYYIYIYIAIMFHAGAIALAIVPLVFLVRMDNQKIVVYVSIITFAIAFVISQTSLSDYLMTMATMLDSEHLKSQVEYYTQRDKYLLSGFSNIGKSLLCYVINVIPLLYLTKTASTVRIKLLQLAYFYVLIALINDFVPIVYRYRDYTYVLYHLSVSTFLVEYSIRKLRHKTILIILLFGLYFYSIRSYFGVNEYLGVPAYAQYYPYYSVINKGESPIRELLYYNYNR